jgi:hypothetical protein
LDYFIGFSPSASSSAHVVHHQLRIAPYAVMPLRNEGRGFERATAASFKKRLRISRSF